MARRYVSDIVGEAYRQWQAGDRIGITTSTGSGKTWFILHKLLRHAKEQGKHLVYFCNRKFLSLQVQSAARRELLNELGEDEEGLAGYLHIRTYQHSEYVCDYPHIKALDEDGKVIPDQWEVRAEDVLYYVFDEAFYVVQDAGFNANTHYWWDTAKIAGNDQAISVFLAATPEPLLLYLQFRCPGEVDLNRLCQAFLARYYIKKDTYTQRWLRWLYPTYLRLEEEYDRWEIARFPPHQQQWVYAQRLAIDAQLRQMQEQYVAACQDPYADLFAQVEQACASGSDMLTYCYQDERSLQEQYDYLDVHYFDDMAGLAGRIAASVRENRRKRADDAERNRWLVFVRRLEDANGLRTTLRALDCSSVVISSGYTKGYDGKICKRKSPVRRVFDALIHEERQDCDVLISTSVLDCGITLRASNVSNLVICQPNKTSFLQMLGRIRAAEEERVALYIQSLTPREVKGHGERILEKFLYLVKLTQKDTRIHTSSIKNVPGIGQFGVEELLDRGFISFLPSLIRKNLLEKLETDRDRECYTYHGRAAPGGTLPLLVNPLAVVYYLAQAHYVSAVLPEYDGDPYYFLKEQLSWLGKTYDPTRWIDYEATYGDLCQFIREKSLSGTAMGREEQEEFRETCFLKLRALRDPPEEFMKAKARCSVENGKYPGLRSLNVILAACQIPYRIISRQSKKLLRDPKTGEKVIDPTTRKPKVDNGSYWMVQPADPEEQRNQTLLRRQQKQEKREECQKEKPAAENRSGEQKDRPGLKIEIVRR